jgi:prevent-host-death family protein
MPKLQRRNNINEAKVHLSLLLQYMEQGDEVIICRAGKPLARLVPFEKAPPQKRVLGQLKGQIHIADDFDELPDEFMKHFGN